ncbi:MAG: Gfo/Idh/MocA family oxidoreductase, partial [Planctomycetes bacterium]|nr:Gfo/Idh/MocA family oxidoreductase [Planctomycetota bacterium]
LGCGRWGRNILRDLVASGCAVVVADPSPAARQDAMGLGATAVLPAWDGRAVDGVVIATPTATHALALEPFLAGATPVFVEKPLCADAAAARRILNRARCPLRVMEKWRYHPATVRLVAIARHGELGATIGLRTRRVQDVHLHRDVDAIWTLAPHDLAIAREILGAVPPLIESSREGEDPSAGVAALFARDGAPWFALDVSARRPRTEREIVLVCAGGSAWFHDATPEVIRIRQGDQERVEALPDAPPLLAQVRAFVAWIAGGPAPKGTLAEAVETVELIDALHHSRSADRSRSWPA